MIFTVIVQQKVKSQDIFVCLLLFDAIATVFQLYHGGDMMYEMRRRKARAYMLNDSRDL